MDGDREHQAPLLGCKLTQMSFVKANQQLFERIIYAHKNQFVLNSADRNMIEQIFSQCASEGKLTSFQHKRALEICRDIEDTLNYPNEVLQDLL